MWYDAMRVIQNWLPDATFTPPNGNDVNGVLTTVPSVGGLPYDQAAQQIKQAGFAVADGGYRDSGYPQDTVAYTSPGSGSRSPAARRSRSTAPTARPSPPGITVATTAATTTVATTETTAATTGDIRATRGPRGIPATGRSGYFIVLADSSARSTNRRTTCLTLPETSR